MARREDFFPKAWTVMKRYQRLGSVGWSMAEIPAIPQSVNGVPTMLLQSVAMLATSPNQFRQATTRYQAMRQNATVVLRPPRHIDTILRRHGSWGNRRFLEHIAVPKNPVPVCRKWRVHVDFPKTKDAPNPLTDTRIRRSRQKVRVDRGEVAPKPQAYDGARPLPAVKLSRTTHAATPISDLSS